MADQPSGMIIDNGVILTVGVQSGYDRVACVIPLCADDSIPPVSGCQSALEGWGASIRDSFLACMSSLAFLRFVQAEGMIDGMIPYREDYAPTDFPGTRGATIMPSQVTGLCVFYEDPADAVVGARMRVGKNFIPGLCADDIAQDFLVPDLVTAIAGFATAMQAGFAGSIGSHTFYRVLAGDVRSPAGTPIKRVITAQARGYVCTQKRRLIPR